MADIQSPVTEAVSPAPAACIRYTVSLVVREPRSGGHIPSQRLQAHGRRCKGLEEDWDLATGPLGSHIGTLTHALRT